MFGQRRKRAAERKVDALLVERSTSYPHRLSFYLTPPLAEITIDEFEGWAIDRLRVLSEIEHLHARGGGNELTPAVKKKLDELLPLGSNRMSSKNVEEERRKDHYSHYILRLVFCRTPELQERFVRLETSLFKMRYNSDDLEDRSHFLKSLDFGWEAVSDAEVEQLEPEISWNQSSSGGAASREYIKLDWTQVADLVDRRQVFLSQGQAYVPLSHQRELVVNEFARRLRRALETTARALPRLDEDDRLLPVLSHLELGMPSRSDFTNSSARAEGDEITAKDIDSLVEHFPLCMRTMHHNSRTANHAMYPVRQQYGGFLKGIGLSVEESLAFWRGVFKTKSDDEFKKEYSYNVRHMYGLEGSRIDFRPMDCLQIGRATDPGHHGCPYRKFSEDQLHAGLKAMGVTDVQELGLIAEDVKKQQYHVACSRVYEITHPQDKRELGTITHPNEYFERSYSLAKELAEEAA